MCRDENDITRRKVSFETRALTAMIGTFGYELDIIEVVSKDKAEGFLLLAQPLAPANTASCRICLRGLDEDALYEVTGAGIVGNGENPVGAGIDQGENASLASDKSGGTVRLHGDTLMRAGYLTERPKGDFRAVMHRIRRIGD